MYDLSNLTARLLIVVTLVLAVTGCMGVPENAKPVQGFELDRYLGTWYEVARLDHSFERGLSAVTATYSMRDDGGVRVVNRGFHAKDERWSEAVGKAYFVGETDTGQLKVSFFGPFYGAYNVIALDKDTYQWSLVSGPNTDYLWILARTPELSPVIVERLVGLAREVGFDADALIFVDHSQGQ
jgi:apolipoprotein D and lipocalin family protein